MGILDIGAIQTGVGSGVPALLLGAAHFPGRQLCRLAGHRLVLVFAIGYIIIPWRKFTINQERFTYADVDMGAGNASGRFDR